AAGTPRPLPGRIDPRPVLGGLALALVLGTLLAAPLRSLLRRAAASLSTTNLTRFRKA
ncbi:VWA domain-containing protein, partial [Methylobacterium sp. WL18]